MTVVVGVYGDVVLIKAECVARTANPSDLARGDTDHQGVRFDVAVDDGSAADQGVFSDRDTANDRRVGSHAASFFEEGFFELFATHNESSGIDDVGKYHAGAEEDVVFALHPFIYANVILYFDAIADGHFRADDAVLSKRAILPDDAFREDMAEMPDFCIVADVDIIVHVAGRVGEKGCHQPSTLRQNG